MAETYKRVLNSVEYQNIFEIASSFKGEASIKTAASKINEKIGEAVRANAVVRKDENGETVLDTNGNPVNDLPSTITVEFSRAELDGFWRGLVEKIGDAETDVKSILILKVISKSLGMSGRFSKYETTTIDMNKVEEDLDEETVDEPLDD